MNRDLLAVAVVVADVGDQEAGAAAARPDGEILPVGCGCRDAHRLHETTVRVEREDLGLVAAVVVCPEDIRPRAAQSEAARLAHRIG